MHKHGYCLIALSLLATFAATADPLLVKQEMTGSNPVTRTETFEVNASPGARVSVVFGVNALRGSLSITPADPPAQTELPQAQVENVEPGRPWTTSGATSIDVPANGLKYEVVRKDFVGEWHLAVINAPNPSLLSNLIPGGVLMMLVALCFFFFWHFKARPGWRWFGLGALLWFVGVAVKMIVAMLLNTPILNALTLHLPLWGYLVLGALYIGLLTGVFEIGPVWLVGWLRPAAALTAARAIAVGIGAGACESFLLGLLNVLQGVMVTMLPVPDMMLVTLGYVLDATPFVILVSPVERVLAILAHVGARTLVLYGIATRRSSRAWLGFWLLTLLDAMAGCAYLAGYIGGHNLWVVEAALVPIAVISLWSTLRCAKEWPDVDPTPHIVPPEAQDGAAIEAEAAASRAVQD